MGGEPTFVSIDDMDGAEWNTAALGPQKRVLSERLLDRLRSRLAPGGLLHYGQGKWYPGEPLPRWALACYWRADGIPLWHDRALLAREGETYNSGPLEAQHFAEALARRLGVDPHYVNQASKIHCIMCSESGNCRSTSIRWTIICRWTAIWMTRRSASACARYSSAA